MKRFEFSKEIELCATIDIDWSKIENKTLMISGATGLVGKYIIEVLLRHNQLFGCHTKIIAVGRSKQKFNERFEGVKGTENLIFMQHNVQTPCIYNEHLDYIIHMASNTHPRLYASDPIGTEMTNIFGTYYLLELASQNLGCRFVLTSSGDIYGDNRSDKPFLDEIDCGYIDCNTLRAGYIEGKRASEALCNAFQESKGVDFVIPRLCRIYGPTVNLEDSKAITQFIKKAIDHEDIVLKSKGSQTFSYLYIFDVVSALLTVITKGKSGEAYNISDNDQVISLYNLANTLAEIGGSKVIFDIPDSLEIKGASTFQDVRLNSAKLKNLGWNPQVGLREGLLWTVKQLRK